MFYSVIGTNFTQILHIFYGKKTKVDFMDLKDTGTVKVWE